MNDPRRGLSSGSKMGRLAECPGSLAMENEIRVSGRGFELPDPARGSGLKIHNWNAKEVTGKITAEIDLSSDELVTARKAAELRNAALEYWRSQAATNNEDELVIEKRFWYRRGLIPLFSAQLDIAVINHAGRRALILDYKSGRLEVEEAADNLQLRTEVVLLKHNYPDLEEISAAIIEPWVSWDSVQVMYKSDDLRQAENQILAIVDSTIWKADKRVAGPWCKHCSAKIYCQEAIDYVQTIPKFDAEKMVAELPRGEAGTKLWERLKVAKKLLEAIETAYTRILQDVPDALPGYVLPERGRGRRRVPFPEQLKEALKEYLTGPEIDGCADYRVARIEELLGIKHRIEDKKELSRLFQQLTKDAITVTFDEPFIRALTRREREMLAKV